MVDVFLSSNVQALAPLARFQPQALIDHTSCHERFGTVVDVLGLPLLAMRQREVVDALVARVSWGIKTRIAFVNAHCANVASGDWQYRQALLSCDAVLPDGIGVEIASRLGGEPVVDDLNGTDLFFPLCEALAAAGKSVFFLGGRPGVADATANAAKARIPSLKIAGSYHGYFGPQDEDAMIERINACQPDVLFVAMGVPAQETWLARVAARIDAPLVAGVGGLFDFVSGATARAPRWMRQARLEWAYRLLQEPQRMWRRYLVGNVTFLSRALSYGWQKRRGARRRSISNALKRALDVSVATTAIAGLSPLLLLAALAIRLESRGSILFRQERVGKNGDTFEMLKFRSMYTDAEKRLDSLMSANDRNDGVTFKLKQDPRVTKVGRFIRKYSIDELPQLFNVVRGEMSLVGPRPALPREVAKYSAQDRGRLAGKPGITGIWQVSGRADIPFQRMVELDVEYLNTRSLFTDIAILARTPLAVIMAKGAY
ncbi:WecB/TagA/CpsF family glycosyltransferase [Maricaulis sp.]|uniref:WecB/TagA/CpsF family glycosyltransferase n=1 Tax=Maricaulis sp. TaxID=1486257 RepID=UPI0025C19389|nr:WecB/TagA/CpsF family glycosyltransferase [Maricaulis sp.]